MRKGEFARQNRSTHPHIDVDTRGIAARSGLNVSESIVRFNWWISMHMSEYMSEYVSTCFRQEYRMHVSAYAKSDCRLDFKGINDGNFWMVGDTYETYWKTVLGVWRFAKLSTCLDL